MNGEMLLDIVDGQTINARWVGDNRFTTAVECNVHPSLHLPHPHVNEVHHVWPLGEGGPDVAANRVVICATGHNNVHELLRLLKKYDGKVPWPTLRQFAKGERELAATGYERIQSQMM